MSLQAHEVLPELIRLVYSGDFETAMTLYDDEAAFVDQPGVVLRDKAAIKQSLIRMKESGRVLEIDVENTMLMGNVAFSVSRWRMTANGAVVASGRATDLFRRGQDGRWRFLLDNPFGASAFDV